MKTIKFGISGLVISVLLSCGGGDDGGDPNTDPVLPPEATTLIFPENNKECNEGIVLSDTESTVVFSWNTSENTDSYSVEIIDLENNTSQSLSAISTTLEVTLRRGVPYSWSVISKSNETEETAESATWNFYNAGLPLENHIPFPAEAVRPKSGSSLDTSTVLLEWIGSDLDGDIDTYEVFVDTFNPPTKSLGSTSTTSMEATVDSNQTYYWKIVTSDTFGNSSESAIFQFKTTN